MGRREKRRHSGFRKVLSQYGVLQSLAEAYDLRIFHAEGKGRVFRINTSQGWKKIKRFKYSLPELEYVHGVLEHLAGKGWKRALPFHLTKDGLPYVEIPEGLFYVTSWIQGEEINSDDPFHLEMAAKIIGEMHRLLQDHRGPDNCPRSFPAHWQDKYAGQAEDLERYRQQAESARKGKFGRRFWKVADDFIRLISIGLQLLDEAGYDRLMQVEDFITVCHTSPTAGNLIAGSDGKIYLIDFDNARADLRIYDLGKMILRHSGWDIDKAVFIIRSYQEANPLTREEISLLPGLCAFPTKGWQVARSFFEEGKAHMGRLEKAIAELARQEAFVRGLAQISPADLVYQTEQLFQTIPFPDSKPAEDDAEESGLTALEALEPEKAGSMTETGFGMERKQSPLASPFYWGDEYVDFDRLEIEELRKLAERLGKVAERLQAISEGVPDETEGGEQETDKEPGPEGLQVRVEVGPADRGAPGALVVVEQGQQLLASEEEAWVAEAAGFSDLVLKEESEVRVDLAANMKYLSDNIPDGRIEPGMDIPVEYAAALESLGEQAVMSSAPQEPFETVEAVVEETAARGTPMEKVDLEKIECTDAEPVDDLVEPSTSQGTAGEEEACPQPVFEAEAAADTPLVEVTAPAEEPFYGEEEVISPELKEAELEEPQLEAAAEVEEAVEITGEGLMADEPEGEPQLEEPLSSSMHTPQPRPVVEWRSFPEPIHRRRRSWNRL
ncbi:MAG TPA: CotS family spore coat protein [Firmicutes bacterium]|nr:CotS family spore coat protein [Bacillota bacterium]